MEFTGKVWKDGKFWLIEVPSFDAMTQGKTKSEALMMIGDLIKEMLVNYFPEENLRKLDIEVVSYKDGSIGIASKNEKLLLALSLRRQREMSGSTVRDAAERLGSTSPNAYAQYEKGKTNVSLEKYEKLISAANPTSRVRIGVEARS